MSSSSFVTSNQILDNKNNNLTIITQNEMINESERYYIVEFEDVLYYDVPYCLSTFSPPPPARYTSSKIKLFFNNVLSPIDCKIPLDLVEDKFDVNFIKVV